MLKYYVLVSACLLLFCAGFSFGTETEVQEPEWIQPILLETLSEAEVGRSDPPKEAHKSADVPKIPDVPKVVVKESKKDDKLSKKADNSDHFGPRPAIDIGAFKIPPYTIAPHTKTKHESEINHFGIDKFIQKAEDLIKTYMEQIDEETSWARAVREIIANYQFRYDQIQQDFKMRTDKLNAIRVIVKSYKKMARRSKVMMRIDKSLDALEVLAAMDPSKKYEELYDACSNLQSTYNLIYYKAKKARLANPIFRVLTGIPTPASSDTITQLLASAKLLTRSNRLKGGKAAKAGKTAVANANQVAAAATDVRKAASTVAAAAPAVAAAAPVVAAAAAAPTAAPAGATPPRFLDENETIYPSPTENTADADLSTDSTSSSDS